MNASNPLQIVFMGTPDFAVEPLQALMESRHEVVAVFSQPPRPKGRGHKVQLSPVHQCAEDNGIAVYNPKSFKKEPDYIDILKELKPDICVVVAYGLLLPQEVLDIPRYGCVNIHGSILPRWRGAAPIQRAIWEGDDKTGISIMQMEKGLDTGPVISAREIDITPKTTAQTLHDDLAVLGAKMIVEIIDKFADEGELEAIKQDDALANYAHMLNKDHGRVDWKQSAEQIDRQIRALTPWPGVWTIMQDGKRLKIKQATVSDIKAGNAQDFEQGQLIDDEGHVFCGDKTVLRLERVQPENAKEMDFKSAVNGGYLSVGLLLHKSV